MMIFSYTFLSFFFVFLITKSEKKYIAFKQIMILRLQ